jgi:inosine-uridine nucleoside N-ribohydrolase
MSETDGSQDDFIALVAAIQNLDASLSPLAAALTVVNALGIARDSRTFARLFDIEHAVVLREINLARGADNPLEIVSRDARTQRTHLRLTVKGENLIKSVLDLGSDSSK